MNEKTAGLGVNEETAGLGVNEETVGLGVNEKKDQSITAEQENQLFISTPFSLVRTLFYRTGLHFGIRGGQEQHRKLSIANCSTHTDMHGNQYLQYTECVTKCNQGGLNIGK